MSKQRERIYRAVILTFLIATGMLVVRIFTLNRAQQRAYAAMVGGLHDSWYQAHTYLTVAIDPIGTTALDLPTRLAPARALEIAERELWRAETASQCYSWAVGAGGGEYPVFMMMEGLMRLYAHEIHTIRQQLVATDVLTPAMRESLTLLRADLELISATLTNAVLRPPDIPTLDRLLADLRRTLNHPVARSAFGPRS